MARGQTPVMSHVGSVEGIRCVAVRYALCRFSAFSTSLIVYRKCWFRLECGGLVGQENRPNILG